MFAGKLAGFDNAAFNPLTIFAEPISALSVWTNLVIPAIFK
jgi:hypothetical protein